MAKQLYLHFLWHMHQPYYKDDVSGRYAMPWVYLHAIKDYYDMAWYLSLYPKLKATFNLVPSLLLQLKDYESIAVDDHFIRTLAKEVDDLSHEELNYLMEFLFFAQKETMVEPIARYAELYRKVKNAKSGVERINILHHDELLDLEICFLLAWCGQYLREHSALIQSLLLKQRYSHADKLALLAELAHFIGRILPFYKLLQERGQIEISTTPFYHPITPLLIDPLNAKRSDERVVMPERVISLPEDAEEHIVRAVEYYTKVFDRKPQGFWPSEGAVDEASIERYIANGIRWICTDETILFRSAPSSPHENLYRRYRFKTGSGEIALGFRDRTLSDAIGFEYSRKDPIAAVEDFMDRLRRIYEGSSKSSLVNVILDGENAWEFYRNNARDFFDLLYKALEQAEWITTQTMSDGFTNDQIDETLLKTIHPGSWINGNFGIWIGHEEKNRAWELLYQTQRDFEIRRDALSEAIIRSIHNELLIAQGSDWYWWFGDTHYSAQKMEFDKLFRKHLKNVYTLMGDEIPAHLITPIAKYETKGIHLTPKNPVSITISGTNHSFFEWMGAGEFNLEKMGSVMDSSTPYVKKLLYGNDDKRLNIALCGSFLPIISKGRIQIRLEGALYCDIPFENIVSPMISMQCSEGFVEISIPLKSLSSGAVDLKIVLLSEDEILQRIPFHGGLAIDLSNAYPTHWFI